MWALAAADPTPVAPVRSPTLSVIVPVVDGVAAHLGALLASFQAQAGGQAEFLLAPVEGGLTSGAGPDPARVLPAVAGGAIEAMNAAVDAARGAWVAFVGEHDLLAPSAANQVVKALSAHPDAEFFYTDEVVAGPRLEPREVYLKPGFDPVLLSGVNYINHLSVFRRSRLQATGGVGGDFHAAWDYDLLLRYCRGLAAEDIVHIPYPAYIWRQQSPDRPPAPGATAAARAAIGRCFGGARPVPVNPAPLSEDLHKPVLAAGMDRWPTVSVIIPNRNSFDLMSRVIDGLLSVTDYPAFEIIVVDNGSTDADVLSLYDRLRADPRCAAIEIDPAPFNFSAMVNRGCRLAGGELLLLLNNDIEVLSPEWLTEMVSCFCHRGTGVVGAKLLYPDRRIQHAGVILGLSDLAGHWYYKQPEASTGPMGRLAVRNSMTVVTGACMLISRACWDDVGDLDEEVFQVAYNDVDFCVRARARGWGVVWTPHATLIHNESASRRSDKGARNLRRFRQEQAALAARHATKTVDDPSHSPWLSRCRSRPRPRRRTDLPAPRHFMGFPAPDDPEP